MTNKTNIEIESNNALLKDLGLFIRNKRLQINKTQQVLADEAGVNRNTLAQIERGKGGTMLSFIQILRALGLLGLLEEFKWHPQYSPLQLASYKNYQRQRASRNELNELNEPPADTW